jgi:Tfp pilus assembly protein PilO
VTKRDRIMISAIAVLAVAGAFFMLVVKPIRADLAGLDEQRSQAAQRRDAAVADLSAASTAREAYRRDTATLALLGKAVPSDDGVPSLLYQLQGAARQAGVRFDAVKVGGDAAGGGSPSGNTTGSSTPPSGSSGSGSSAPSGAAGAKAATLPGVMPGPEGLSVLPLKITFQGSFFKLERFLNRVHRFAKVGGERVDIHGRLLTIEGVSLAPGTAGLPQLKAEISAQAYVAPEASQGGAGSAKTASTTTTTSTSGAGETR